MGKTRIGIVGSRIPCEYLKAKCKQIVAQYAADAAAYCIVSGGARGIDSLAEREARRAGIEVVVHRPQDPSCARSYHARNRRIVEDSDKIHALWDCKSKGTLSTIKIAGQAGVPVAIYTPWR